MAGSGKLTLTGKLGDVMKESAQTALSWIRANAVTLRLSKKLQDRPLKNADVHIHFPAGAIPKDGPSAGCEITAMLFSLLSGRQCRGDTAVTGEVTLRGTVLPVGGIKEKLIAAFRAGCTRVCIPSRNEKVCVLVLPLAFFLFSFFFFLFLFVFVFVFVVLAHLYCTRAPTRARTTRFCSIVMVAETKRNETKGLGRAPEERAYHCPRYSYGTITALLLYESSCTLVRVQCGYTALVRVIKYKNTRAKYRSFNTVQSCTRTKVLVLQCSFDISDGKLRPQRFTFHLGTTKYEYRSEALPIHKD